jgi:hypothetical protein
MAICNVMSKKRLAAWMKRGNLQRYIPIRERKALARCYPRGGGRKKPGARRGPNLVIGSLQEASSFAFWAANSSSVRIPWAFSSPSSLSWSIVDSPPPVGGPAGRRERRAPEAAAALLPVAPSAPPGGATRGCSPRWRCRRWRRFALLLEAVLAWRSPLLPQDAASAASSAASTAWVGMRPLATS